MICDRCQGEGVIEDVFNCTVPVIQCCGGCEGEYIECPECKGTKEIEEDDYE